jgi:acetyl-CoA carboxylase biotin carboxyl carrier protein
MNIESPDFTRRLAGWLAATDIARLELRGPGGTLALDNGRSVVVNAPSVGVLRHRHPLREAALAPPGTRVRAGQPLALLQVGGLLLPVPAPADGVVARHVAADGAIVGYGDPLVEFTERNAWTSI